MYMKSSRLSQYLESVQVAAKVSTVEGLCKWLIVAEVSQLVTVDRMASFVRSPGGTSFCFLNELPFALPRGWTYTQLWIAILVLGGFATFVDPRALISLSSLIDQALPAYESVFMARSYAERLLATTSQFTSTLSTKLVIALANAVILAIWASSHLPRVHWLVHR